ncbi:MAG: DUF1080 domain-containing protein [Chthoniobacter sp.]|uniref:3-keto-disaccharide hydrolase n=1 Tax=Chthoniobacter sp. TaxID=2510640 RepID=UPI0032A2EC91
MKLFSPVLALVLSFAVAPALWAVEEVPIAPPLPITLDARVELFNGKDLAGWKMVMKDATDPATVWSVADGVIKCLGKPNGYIRTEKAYRNYKLTVEWRFTKAGNTGVLVHMHEPDKVWPRCFECQGKHDRQGDFWLWGGADCKEPKIPGKNGIAMVEASNEKPVGEWNTYEVECWGNSIKIIVNGKLMNTATECTENSGMIGIQSEGAEVEVRKIFVEPLKG